MKTKKPLKLEVSTVLLVAGGGLEPIFSVSWSCFPLLPLAIKSLKFQALQSMRLAMTAMREIAFSHKKGAKRARASGLFTRPNECYIIHSGGEKNG